MAVVYWDPETGDDANAGTADAPVLTLGKAAELAGAGGEVRCAGRQLVDLGTATFAYGSRTVTFASDVSGLLAAGDVIIADGWPMPVDSVDGSTVTLVAAAYLPDGQYSVRKAVLIPISAPQTASSLYPDVTFSFGWDLSTETQPDGWATCFSLGAAINDGALRFDGDGTTLRADGRLFIVNNNNAYDDGLIAFPAYRTAVTGALAGCCLPGYPDPPVRVVRDSAVYIEELRVNYMQSLASLWACRVEIERAVMWNMARCANGSGLLRIRHFEVHGTSSLQFTQYGTIYEIEMLTAHSAITNAWTEMEAQARVRLLVGEFSGFSTTFHIGGPVSQWCVRTHEGVVDKTTGGRGGASDLCVRFDPTSRGAPLMCPLRVPGVSSGTLTLQFYARYTGTSAPACWVECQGQRYEFSPQQADAWSDDQLVTLSLSVEGDEAELQATFCVTDNAEGDALVYIDDITLTDGATTWQVDLQQEAIGLLADPTPPTPTFPTPLRAELQQQHVLRVVVD